MTIITFRVDKETYKLLKQRAEEEGITLSDLMRAMIEKYIGVKIGVKNEIEKKLEEIENKLKEHDKKLEEIEKTLRKVAGIYAYRHIK